LTKCGTNNGANIKGESSQIGDDAPKNIKLDNEKYLFDFLKKGYNGV
jgi:hypothetical protein